MDAKAEKIALFRYGLIAPLVLELLPRGELTRRAEEIACRHYEIPASRRTSISVDTLLDWALRYRNGGFEALAPQPRQDRDNGQLILVSHHPETLNQWARLYGLRLFLEQNGQARTAKFMPDGSNLQPSEVIARGWE